ncbi:iron-sulfur cluster carrier protein ApbC [Burkholderiaceae bacterium DAT-1]|nr:iron-sulfur cluster carrier protein ApbC [Burkholderiaceae bacterium DAT-1]
MSSAEHILSVLNAVVDPEIGRDWGSLKALRELRMDGDIVSCRLVLPFPARSRHDAMVAGLQQALRHFNPQLQLNVIVEQQIEAHTVQRGLTPLPGVRNVIAVASGKGGVGKSTTAVNLALALAAEGAKVGVLDADIYGPSQPQMLGLNGQKPNSPDGKSIEPLLAHGLQAMSIGFLIDADQPMVWRGPMVTQALMQLLNDTKWQDLDYLVVDLPPGTGDIQLTLSQKIPVTGAVVVTTPQDIALLDARKGIRMFEKVGIPILGIVENMAVHVCSNCGHAEPIFGEGGGAGLSEEYHVSLLGQLPLEMHIRLAADSGAPTVVSAPDSLAAQTYRKIARSVAIKVSERAKDFSARMPKIVIRNS